MLTYQGGNTLLNYFDHWDIRRDSYSFGRHLAWLSEPNPRVVYRISFVHTSLCGFDDVKFDE